MSEMRHFESGATRNVDTNKYDPEAFLSPLVLERFSEYMHKNRFQADGKVRDGDNWQKGIPLDAYMKSGWRHFFDWWKEHRKIKTTEGLEEALCALMFNVMGYLFEILKEKQKASMTLAEHLAAKKEVTPKDDGARQAEPRPVDDWSTVIKAGPCYPYIPRCW